MSKKIQLSTSASENQAVRDMDRLLKVKEVARILALSEKAVYELVWRGELSCFRLGARCIRISEEQVREFLARSEELAGK